MRLLLHLLLAVHVTVFFDIACAQEILTNDAAVLDENDPARVMKKMARSQEKILNILKSLMIEIKTAKFEKTSEQATDWYCSPPFIKYESMCFLAMCSPARWSMARQTCDALGGDLIWLESGSEHVKVNAFFKKFCASASQYWTSLRNQNGKLQWGDRGISTYTTARILNLSQKNFASSSSSVTLRGQTPISKLAYVCREAPKIAEDSFQQIELKELDINAFGVNLGSLGLSSCSAICISRGPTCIAFHRSLAGICFIIDKTNTEFWTMKVGVPPSFYFVRVKNLASKCSSAKFPYSHGASRYRYNIERKKWNESRASCEALGGKLAEFPSKAELGLIAAEGSKIEGFNKGGPWASVGLRQKPGSKEPKGGWIWYSSGLPVTGGWDSGEPNNHKGKEQVGEMTFTGVLNDRPEEDKGASICECSVVS